MALAVVFAGTSLHAGSPALATPGRAGPTFGDGGTVVLQVRPSSDDFGTALAMQDDDQVIVAAGAGGDFGLVRRNEYLWDGVAFGPVDGHVTTDFGGTDDVARAVTVTGSGEVVAAGSAGGDLAVARYQPGGVLDRSFDGDGRLTVDLGGPADSAFAVAALPDGRLLVVGGTGSAVSVLRVLSGGGLDPGFGDAGRATVAAPGPGRAAVLQPDGKLLVAGGGDRMTVYRFLADGGLDPSYGAGGMASVPAGQPGTAYALVLGPDGSATVAGNVGPDVAIARLDATGRLDPGFGTAGTTVTRLGVPATGYGIAQRADGALVVVGDAGDRGLAVRYTPGGVVDTSFGTAGHLVTSPSPIDGSLVTHLRAVVAHPDDGWIVAGTLGTDAVVARLYETGALGREPVDFGHEYQRTRASAVQADGRIVAVAEAGGDVALARFYPDGSRDGSFGASGLVVSDRAEYPSAVAVQPSGRIIVAAGASTGPSRATLLGFRADGSTDPSFGVDGRADVDLTGGSQLSSGLAVQPDGRLVVVGFGSAGTTLARLTENGSPDPTFGAGGRIVGALIGYPVSGAPVLVQPDGRIVFLAAERQLASSPDRRDELPAVVRFNADGSADNTFGVGGKVHFERMTLSLPTAVALQADGRIVVAGLGQASVPEMTALRLRPDGSPDPTWTMEPSRFAATFPYITSAAEVSAISIQADGRVLVGGLVNGGLALTRRLPDGRHDDTFGVHGLLPVPRTPGAVPVAIVVTNGAGLVMVGTEGVSAWPSTGFLLARVATGQLGVPTAVVAVAGNGSARVRWARPPLFDDSPITAYRVTASDGVHGVTTSDLDRREVVVKGLAPGRPYTFTVQAVRVTGDGPRSAPSNPITTGLASPTSAWGGNAGNQLGAGPGTDRLAPVVGAGVPGAVALAAGAFHSIALRADGTVWTWGWGGLGQLGDGTRATRPTPAPVPGMTNVVAIAAGAFHSMALKADGTVWVWGWNGLGQLGTGTIGDAIIPVQPQGLTGIAAFAAGFHHSLAVRTDGTVMAWGWNLYGMLGDGSTADSPIPKPVPGLTGIASVSGGALHSMALGRDGRMWTWGWNGAGQLGTYDLVDHRTPVLALAGERVTAIAAGAYHSFALQPDGTVRSFGWNAFGQLGNPSTDLGPGILNVWHLDDVVSIASGWYHGLAVKHDGTVMAWGANSSGQLGDGTRTDRSTVAPVRVPGAVAVAGGAFHSLSS